MDRPDPGRLTRWLASPRNRMLLAVAVVLAIVRIALPELLRPILVARADQALIGRIELEDLDLALFSGGVTLHGFSVHSDERPSQAPAVFEADRLHSEISWLALLSRTLRIEDFEIEGFAVRLDRFAEGLLLPKPVAGGEPEEPDSSSGTWSLAADLISLRDGRIELFDHTVKGEPERFELAIEDFSARELAIRNDPEDDEPGRIAIEAKLDQGSVSLAAWIKQYEAGMDVRSTLTLVDIPIGKLRAYLPMFDWNGLAGNLDAALEHHYAPDGAHDVKGKASLSKLRIDVPAFEQPALAWENLEVVLERIDLVKRRAEIASIRSTGAHLLVDPRSETPLVLLAPPADKPRPDDAVPATSSTEQDPKEAGDPDESGDAVDPGREGRAEAAWSWRVGKADVANLVLDLRGAEAPLLLRAEAALTSLASDPDLRAPVTLSIASEQGRLELAGELLPSPFAFDGKLSITDLSLAPLTAQIEAPALHWLRAGALRADLDLVLGNELHASGQLGLAGLDLAEAETAKRFGVEWKDLDLTLQDLAFIPPSDLPDGAKEPSLDVRLSQLRLREPRFVLTHDEHGVVLPALLPAKRGADTDAETALAAQVGDPETTAVDAAAQPTEADAVDDSLPAAPTPLAIRVSIADARVEGAQARLADRAVEPFYRGRIENLDLHATGIRWPANDVDALELQMEGLRGAKLSLAGSIHPGKAKLKGELVELPLDQFNPYLASTGYNLREGALSLASKARFESQRFKTTSKVVFSSLDVGGDEGAAAFEENFGISLAVAIGLLEDLDGRIKLAIPVAGKRDKVRVGLGRIVGQALRKALVGALASPLKLLGASTRDGKVERLAPLPVRFAAGSSELSEEGAARIEELASLLAASPGLTLELSGQGSESDQRVLHERALLAQLEASRGVRALSALGEISTRRAVRDYLGRKLAGGDPKPLSSAETRWLETTIAQSARPTSALESLAIARVDRLRELLTSEHGIADARLVLGSPRIDPPAGEPGVAIVLGAVRARASRASSTP